MTSEQAMSVWFQAYCAALQGAVASRKPIDTIDDIRDVCYLAANAACEDYKRAADALSADQELTHVR
jgi:hypothetical protein